MKKKSVVVIAGSQTMINSGQLGYENIAQDIVVYLIFHRFFFILFHMDAFYNQNTVVNMKYTDIGPIIRKITKEKVYIELNIDKDKRRRNININDLTNFIAKHRLRYNYYF